MNSRDQNAFRFGHYQLNQTTIEVDRLSSVSEIVVWLRETNTYYVMWRDFDFEVADFGTGQVMQAMFLEIYIQVVR